MTAKGFFKTEPKVRFTVKAIRGGYFAVINQYDKSHEGLYATKEEAEKASAELNNLPKTAITVDGRAVA